MRAYVVSQFKKGRREVFERNMSAEEQDKFSGAKGKDITNYIVSQVLETLPPDVTPLPSEVMRMRWVLEWKLDELTGDAKAKARLVILRYLDPQYEHRPTTAPVMTKTSRHLTLQMISWLK